MKIQILDPELYEEELRESAFAQAYIGDAGIDLRAREDAKIVPGETAAIPLGVAVQLPSSCFGLVTGRGATHLKFGLLAHPGVVDAGYRGEIHAFLTALGSPVEIKRRDRIVQLVTVLIAPPTSWQLVDELAESERGDNRFGSSGLR